MNKNKYKQFVEETGQGLRFTAWLVQKKKEQFKGSICEREEK